MKIASIIGLLVAAIITFVAHEAVTITEPYVIKAMTVKNAPNGTKVGHIVDANKNTLTVYSSNDIVVISDPGASFLYEEIWLVENPTRNKSKDIKEYQYTLPKYVKAEKIHPLGSSAPPIVLEVATGNKWK